MTLFFIMSSGLRTYLCVTLMTGLTEQKYLPRPAGHRAGAVAAAPTRAARETGCRPRPPTVTRSCPLPSQSGRTGNLPHVLPQGRDETRKQGAPSSSISAFRSEPCSPCPVVQTQNLISLSQDRFPRPVLLLLGARCVWGEGSILVQAAFSHFQVNPDWGTQRLPPPLSCSICP